MVGIDHPVRFVAAVTLGSAVLYATASIAHRCTLGRRRPEDAAGDVGE
jgi:hypothetical protein